MVSTSMRRTLPRSVFSDCASPYGSLNGPPSPKDIHKYPSGPNQIFPMLWIEDCAAAASETEGQRERRRGVRAR
jgi:hypothetical protein